MVLDGPELCGSSVGWYLTLVFGPYTSRDRKLAWNFIDWSGPGRAIFLPADVPRHQLPLN